MPLPALITHLKYLDAPRYPSEWLVAVERRLDEMAGVKQTAAQTSAQSKAVPPVPLRLGGAEVIIVAAVIVLVIILLTTKGGPGGAGV